MSVDHRPAHLTEPRWMRGILLGIALLFLTLFLLVPLAAVFAEAFRKGWALYRRPSSSRTPGRRSV